MVEANGLSGVCQGKEKVTNNKKIGFRVAIDRYWTARINCLAETHFPSLKTFFTLVTLSFTLYKYGIL